MDSNSTLVGLFALLMAAIVACSPAACTANRHNQISAAIQAGADPIETKCAIEADQGQSTLCIVAAMKKEPRK